MQKSKLQQPSKAEQWPLWSFKMPKYSKFLLLTYIFALCLLPFDFISASSIYIDSKHADFFVGDTISFNVRVDSENKAINAVEGSITLDYPAESASLININTSSSQFSLWPDKPSPSDNNTAISFAGGVPGGLNSKDATILNIVLKLEKEGQITLTPKDFSVYLHDGSGTKDTIKTQKLTINVLPEKTDRKPANDLSNLISADKTPPKPFEIFVEQDDTVFEGKKFLSFTTTDEGSGIKYYEVIEGDLPPIRSDGTYLLQNQDKIAKIKVIAYDGAGNTTESVYSSVTTGLEEEPIKYSYTNIAIAVLFTLLLLVLVRFILKKKKR